MFLVVLCFVYVSLFLVVSRFGDSLEFSSGCMRMFVICDYFLLKLLKSWRFDFLS